MTDKQSDESLRDSLQDALRREICKDGQTASDWAEMSDMMDRADRARRGSPPVPAMSLRDYFAGQAIIATIAQMATKDGIRAYFLPPDGAESECPDDFHALDLAARAAYDIADAMLEARRKP